MYLPDINFWLAIVFDSSDQHWSAMAWFNKLQDQTCRFCRLTQMGFLRLATNPKAFPNDAVTMNEAWELYRAMLQDPLIEYITEPADIEVDWHRLTQRETFSPKVWNDAYLAAFAKVADLKVVTYDTGFRKFAGVDCIILK